MTEAGPDGLMRFMSLALGLKRVRRQGWLDRGVDDAESVADHSWSVALLAWLLAADHPDLDRPRVLLLGIVHDLPEALAGDSTPFDAHRNAAGEIPEEHFSSAPEYTLDRDTAKRELEEAALTEMTACLGDDAAKELRDAWREYDDALTPEARFVKQVDKLEAMIQARAYRDIDQEIVIESFLRGADRDIVDPVLRRHLRGLLEDS